ncbi:cobalt ABC transporter permease [Salinigranum rubrum]|uniref:Cobalt ABC transporter permease n=1 Tax=Salinigranum rubrum TaxID=755307 RepID=A0A2I8VN98_9EURY|nr:energy-coupling factor transporter transmembrane protein EcfT [Salinigranum rubrum]AUV83398.1 cobalt ABC transporter permease [Salinigranum rubrum]
MSLSYVAGDSLAHRLDPRTKLALQAGFAVAAVAHTTPTGLLVLTAVTLVFLRLASTPVVASLRSYRAFLPFLVAAPVVEALTLGAPWLVVGDAVRPALASCRVLLLLLVSTAYIRTTPVRASRAAIQHLLPGRVGVLLGAGVGLVLRFLPLMRHDLATIRSAMAARLGDQRSLYDRIRLVGVTGLGRVFLRADRLSLALRARCFAWNPTLPPLSFARRDYPVLALSILLALTALV